MVLEIPLLLFARLIWGHMWAVDLSRACVIIGVSAVIRFAFVAKRLRVWQALLVAPIYFPVIGALLGMIVIPFALVESP